MKIFVTRVWGFDPENWPLVTFNLEGNRDKLLKQSAPGDRIVFVGTLREPTPDAMRGRLLGMAEIGRIPIDTEDFLAERAKRKQDFDQAGQFRWPKAVPMVSAWRFEPSPMLLDVVEEQLPYHATPQAVALSAKDAEAIIALDTVAVKLPDLEVLNKQRLLRNALDQANPTTGLRPTTSSHQVIRNAERPACTYAFRFGNTNVWKIGHTVNVTERLKQVNWHIPSEVIQEKWQAVFRQAWKSETEAYEMEQRVLGALASYRTQGERAQCSEQELRNAWIVGIGAK